MVKLQGDGEETAEFFGVGVATTGAGMETRTCLGKYSAAREVCKHFDALEEVRSRGKTRVTGSSAICWYFAQEREYYREHNTINAFPSVGRRDFNVATGCIWHKRIVAKWRQSNITIPDQQRRYNAAD